MRFFLGVHEPSWLGRTDVPLFYSRNRLARYKSWPRAKGPWALDSSGYSVLTRHGCYPFTSEQYVSEVRRWRDEIGQLEWAASMDYMCEPQARVKTKLSVDQHQRLTIENFLRLQDLAPEIAWVPVLQGQTIMDYWYHLDCWEASGVDLVKAPAVGVGSICRMQATKQVRVLIATLQSHGMKLHGFGLKRTAFKSNGVASCLDSADSMAWSTNARKSRNDPGGRMPGCAHGEDGLGSCANCMKYALWWREATLAKIKTQSWAWQDRIDFAAMKTVWSGDPETDTLLRYAPRFMAFASMAFESAPKKVVTDAHGTYTTISAEGLGVDPGWSLLSSAQGLSFGSIPMPRDFRPSSQP